VADDNENDLFDILRLCGFPDVVDLLQAQQAEIVRLRAERDAERALADQLAKALAAVKADRPSVHTHEVWTAVCNALDDYGKARRER
jgi:hypothetical protein